MKTLVKLLQLDTWSRFT